MTINFSIDVPNNKLGETLLQLAQVFGHQPVTTTVDPQTEYKRSEPEKAVKPAPVNTEKAVKQTEAGLVNETLITCIKSPKS